MKRPERGTDPTIAEDGHSARLASYNDRTSALYGHRDLSDDELQVRLEARGFTASTAARMVEVRDDEATAEYIERQLEPA